MLSHTIGSVQPLNYARGQATTISALQEFARKPENVNCLLQEAWCDRHRNPPTMPNFDRFTPTPTRPRCATYICRVPGLSSTTTFTAQDSFLGTTITSLQQQLYGTIPKIGHLRRFGCRAYKHIPPAQRTEKKSRNHSSMCMMLGYVHNTTKIWRIWDFKSGKIGRAVECSSVAFAEEENAHTEEQTEAIEFPNTTDEAQTDGAQDKTHEMNDAHGLENTSK